MLFVCLPDKRSQPGQIDLQQWERGMRLAGVRENDIGVDEMYSLRLEHRDAPNFGQR